MPSKAHGIPCAKVKHQYFEVATLTSLAVVLDFKEVCVLDCLTWLLCRGLRVWQDGSDGCCSHWGLGGGEASMLC